MADPSRFPQLAVPFAFVGAAAGWLSARLVVNPILSFYAEAPIVVGCATVVATLLGLLLTRMCAGKRYWYELGEPDPDLRPPWDHWAAHIVLVLAAGATTGWLVAELSRGCDTQLACALGGTACAMAFIPVCLAVIAAARRAQRARLGSIVAGSDRRAVWGILAMLLGVMTLEVAPDWPAYTVGFVDCPCAVVGLLGAVAVVTLLVLLADIRALAAARRAIGDGSLSPSTEESTMDAEVPRVDLGLGADLLARVARGAAAYRNRDRTVALLKGSPELAVAALTRAVRRGAIGVAVLGTVALAHAWALTSSAFTPFHALICTPLHHGRCDLAAERFQKHDPSWLPRVRASLYD